MLNSIYEMVPVLKYAEINSNKVKFQPNFCLNSV